MTDIPSRSFGSNISWFCKNDTDLLNLFNKNFPLPNQASWTVFSPSNSVIMKVISVLRMQNFEMGEWLQLKKAGKNVEKIGVPLSDLCEWSLGYRHRWELLVICYHSIRGNCHNPFLGVIFR